MDDFVKLCFSNCIRDLKLDFASHAVNFAPVGVSLSALP